MALYLATGAGPVVVAQQDGSWIATHTLAAMPAAETGAYPCIAVDPLRPERIFFGAARRGVWRSDDTGATWHQVFVCPRDVVVTALAVSEAERVGDRGVAYLGTEPSALYRSEDGGATWHAAERLRALPSEPMWAFPPRPESDHVRWILPDTRAAGRLLVAIEAGALVSSPDGGQTWRDRVPGGPFDTHQLAAHPAAPGHLWSAAGDGFLESADDGATWRHAEAGLRCRYGWSVAVDPADAGTLVLTAAPSARHAHSPEAAASSLFRRVGGGAWSEVRAGLPDPAGQLIAVVATHPREPHTFYAGIGGDLYRSTDAGATWHRLPIAWPAGWNGARIHALVAAGD